MNDSSTGNTVLVVMPTYDELENLPRVAGHLLATVENVDLLIVDDASPDGTGRIADELSAADPRVSVLHRVGRRGLGTAYLEGFEIARERGYAVVCEMDADGSHPAETLPQMLAAVSDSANAVALAIGSRWVRGGSVVDWPKRREALSRLANLYSRLALGIRIRDSTGGYRAYRVDAMGPAHVQDVSSRGYCFQIDMTLRILDAGFDVVEIPIVFVERQAGVSKMSGNIIGEALINVAKWGVTRRFGRRSGRRSPARLAAPNLSDSDNGAPESAR